MHKLWPNLVHVHIATEVFVTLHPGATGLCFMIKVWLVTLYFQVLRDIQGHTGFSSSQGHTKLLLCFMDCLGQNHDSVGRQINKNKSDQTSHEFN